MARVGERVSHCGREMAGEVNVEFNSMSGLCIV
jgi:hypothetical protein